MASFWKMHGLGNDFVVIDGVSQSIDCSTLPVAELARRHTGIGFDQLLLIQPSHKADFSCRIFNADGSEAEQCGNGMRCVARFVHETGLSKKDSLQIETKAGVVTAIIHHYDAIEVGMGRPCFSSPDKIRFSLPDKKNSVELVALSMGNPHAILFVDSLADTPVAKWGPVIAQQKEIFPHGVNVGFVEIVNSQHIRLRTFERGVGETLACGSNACAAVAAGIKHELLISPVKVELELGALWVSWTGKEGTIVMKGAASKVFAGEI